MPKLNNLTAWVFMLWLVFVGVLASPLMAGDTGNTQLKESDLNIPVRLSFKYIDQFRQPAENLKVKMGWLPMVPIKDRKNNTIFVIDQGDSKFVHMVGDADGKLIYQNDDIRCPGGIIAVEDNRYINESGPYDFALCEYHKKTAMDHIKDRGVHQFNPDNPEIIRVWRRIGFKPLVRYEGRNNEIDLTSAAGEVRFDLSTFEPVEEGGDIILKWEIGDTVPPDDVIVWIKRPEQWGRQLHYTITTVDGQMWPIVDGPDQKNWRSVHGILVDHMPPGQPACDVKTTLLPRGNPLEQRFLLMSRNAQLCAKVSLEFSLRDSVKGLIRVNFNDTVVNPSGPPSLEIQPSDERDNSEGEARQKMTIINKKLRSIGVGPLPNPGPTADVAWAAYEKACAERGIKPLPRPQGK